MFFNVILTLLLLNPLANIYSDAKPFFHIATDVNAPVPERINEENIGVIVAAKRFAAIDVASGKLLLQKDSSVQQPIASITKLMTALVILDENPRWNQEVEMMPADETIGARPHIMRGEVVSFQDLWKSALVSSDNNAIMAMVRSLGFSESEFAERMNQKAKELEMFNSSFIDPTGLGDQNISTALDVSRLIHAAMQKNEIRESVLQKKYSFAIKNTDVLRTVETTDVLLKSFLNDSQYGYELLGGKTGFTYEAGYCLAVEISKDDHPVIVVVLNSDTIDSRFQDVKVVADWVYGNYKW